MERKIRGIDIVLENCAIISIPSDVIKNLFIGPTTKTYIQTRKGHLNISKHCKKATITLNTGLFRPMGVKVSTTGYLSGKDQYEEVMRVLHDGKNIARICIVYEDNTEDEIHMPWNDGEYYGANYAQQAMCLSKDEITIEFNKKWKPERFSY
jgi:hypothetical protein